MGLFKWLKDKFFPKPKPKAVVATKPLRTKDKYKDPMGDYITPKNIGHLDPMYNGQFVKYNKDDQDRKIYVLFAKTGAGEVYWEPDDPGMVSTYYYGTGYTNELLKKYNWSMDEMIETVCQKQIGRGDTVVGILFFEHD